MKHQPKVISQTLPNTNPVLSIKHLRVTRNKLKSQIYLFSILTTDKYFELQRELESFISDRSFLELDLNKSMLLLAELIQLKQQTENVCNQFTFFQKQLEMKGAK